MPISATELPTPSADEQALSEQLQTQLRQLAATQADSLGFDQWMEQTLYAPGLGYYSAGQQKFGAQGDFTTAPELGDLFAECLAARLAPVLKQFDDPSLLELGPGSGALMQALLPALEKRGVTLANYWLLERSAECRRQQQAAVNSLSDAQRASVSWLDQPPSNAFDGVIFANEVLDALPAKRYQLENDEVLEQRIAWRNDRWCWHKQPADEALAEVVAQRWQQQAPPAQGFIGEIIVHLDEWLESVTVGLRRGLVLLVDYGYPRSALLRPERAGGTLVCHYRHRVHHDALWWPGVQDISCFVDFTAVAEAAGRCRLELAAYTTQAGFLMTACPGDLEARLQNADSAQRYAMASEFRQLTAPEQMGERFQVMALCRDFSLPTRDWIPDWRPRL
jgi:SAM-dependent MidA family methyltransferase